MNPRPVALLAALLPFCAVHLTYFVAAANDLVPWCIPYIDSCTSISATGRHAPASYVFRGTMLPAAGLLLVNWWLVRAWLLSLSPERGARLPDTLFALAVLACCGLVAYVTVLGEVGSQWQQQRRIGIVLYFCFTYLAQLLLVARLRLLAGTVPVYGPFSRGMLATCIVLLLLGLATVIWQAVDGAGYDQVEDAFEWVLALLLQLNYLLLYLLWRRTGWALRVVQRP